MIFKYNLQNFLYFEHLFYPLNVQFLETYYSVCKLRRDLIYGNVEFYCVSDYHACLGSHFLFDYILNFFTAHITCFFINVFISSQWTLHDIACNFFSVVEQGSGNTTALHWTKWKKNRWFQERALYPQSNITGVH